jgi:AcrR family transcriptional regulator
MSAPKTRDTTTEQAILEAAEELFLEKGLALTSTVEIAKKAQCNQALVHYYYRSKDRLFEAIFQKKASLFLASLLQISSEHAPFEEKLRRKVELHFDMLMANPRLPFLLFNELTTNPQRLLSIKKSLAELPAAMFSQLTNELETEIKKGTIRPMSPVDLILLIISLNVVPFLARPIIAALGSISEETLDSLLQKKKRENTEMIIRAIRP